MSPVEAEAITWSAVPVIVLTPLTDPPLAVKVMDPPRETVPPPDNPDPALIVIELFAKSVFVTVPSSI